MTEKTYAFELDDDDNDEEGRGALQSAVYDDEDEEMDEYDEDEWDEDDEEEDETEEEEDPVGPAVAGTSTADPRVLPLAGDEEDAEDDNDPSSDEDVDALSQPGRTYHVGAGKVKLLEQGMTQYVQTVERKLERRRKAAEREAARKKG